MVLESTRQNCQLKSYREVPPDRCAQVCCHSTAGTKWSAKASCPGKEMQVVAARECDDVCCKVPGKRNAVMKEGDCRDRNGWVSTLAECGTTVEVEKPAGLPEDGTSPPAPAGGDMGIADRPPATTPYM
jgi:hypothetical protein